MNIKLGLMKQFVEALPKDGDRLKYIKFPHLSERKFGKSIFMGPDILKLMFDSNKIIHNRLVLRLSSKDSIISVISIFRSQFHLYQFVGLKDEKCIVNIGSEIGFNRLFLDAKSTL